MALAAGPENLRLTLGGTKSAPSRYHLPPSLPPSLSLSPTGASSSVKASGPHTSILSRSMKEHRVCTLLASYRIPEWEVRKQCMPSQRLAGPSIRVDGMGANGAEAEQRRSVPGGEAIKVARGIPSPPPGSLGLVLK